MRTYAGAFLIAFLVSATLTPLVRIFALRIGAVSVPGGRHVHAATTPRLGGIAICLALFAPLLLLYFVQSGLVPIFRLEDRRVAGLCLGGLVMCGVGAVDDARSLSATTKLVAQVAVAIVAYAAGFRIPAIEVPFVGELSMGPLALPVTVLWIVGIINAVNLIDGLDGLAAGVVFFAGLTNFVVAHLSGSIFVALVTAAMLGSVLGFLLYNFNPARIFMGDSGSYFLGYMLATVSLAGALQKASTAVSLLVPGLALGVPIFDTLLAMTRRYLEKRPVFEPDRRHLHHRLLDAGFNHRRAVLLLYGVCSLFTLSAIGIAFGRKWQVGLALAGSSLVLFLLVRFVGYFDSTFAAIRRSATAGATGAAAVRVALPRFFVDVLESRAEAALWDALRRLIDSASLERCDLTARGTPLSAPILSLSSAKTDVRPTRDSVSARFALGAHDAEARADLTFWWRSDAPGSGSEIELLLHLAADVVREQLVRLQSNYAPTSPAERAGPLRFPDPTTASERVARYQRNDA